MNVVADLDPSDPRAASCPGVEQLIREHRNTSLLLLMLDSYFAALSAGDDVDESLLLDAIAYLIEFIDGYHHPREQIAIEAAAPRCPAIAAAERELEEQHRRIAQVGAELHGELEQALNDEPVPRYKLIAAGFAYTAEMRRNMEQEEAGVFPALAEVLRAEDWRLIDARTGSYQDPLFGETVDERYAHLFDELTSRFGCGEEARYE